MIANGLPHNLDSLHLLVIAAALPWYISILENMSLRAHRIEKMKSITDEPTTSVYDKTFIAYRQINLLFFHPTIRSTTNKLPHTIHTTTTTSYANVNTIANRLPHYLSSLLLVIHSALSSRISTPEHLPLRDHWIIPKKRSTAEPTTSVYDKTFIANHSININNTLTSLRTLNPTTNYLTTQPQSSKFKYHPPKKFQNLQ